MEKARSRRIRGGLAAAVLTGVLLSAAASHASWPSFRGTPRQLGTASGRLPATLKLAWKFKAGNGLTSSAVIDKGKAYFGSADTKVYAVGLKDGAKVWEFKTNGSVEASPCVVGSSVVIGSSDGFLYCLDANKGTLRWKYKTEDKILGAANWAPAARGKGTWVLVGSYDNRLHCVDLATGKAVWTYETENYVNGTPAISNGNVIFGGCDGTLYVIRLADGKAARSIPLKDYIAGSAAVDGKFAYLGHYGNEVLSADVTTGKVQWTFSDRRFPYFSSPAVAPDRIVIGGRDKQVHCLSRKDGKELWTFRTRGKVDSSPVICDAKVVVGSEDGRLYILGLNDGKELWSYEIGGPVMSSPAISDGMVLVGANDGTLYAFGS